MTGANPGIAAWLSLSKPVPGFSAVAGRWLLVALLLASLLPGTASAEWTGISLNLSNTDSDWKFRGDTREAKSTELSFQIEERTSSGLSVGGIIGYFDLRVAGDGSSDTLSFDGQYLGVYLRQEFDLTESLSLHGKFGFKYSSGTESSSGDTRADIDWTESDLELGIGVRVRNLRIMPFAAWTDVDGDISDDIGTDVFELDRPDTQGVRFDIYVEQTAFVRLEFSSGARSGGSMVFVRQY